MSSLSRSGAPRCATGARRARRKKSASARRSCRNGRGGPRVLDALLPVLYLRGVSTGDFQEALAALLGKDARNLSPAVIARLTAEWQADYDAWRRRDLSARRYVYVWADGVYLQARMEDAAECMLVLIGATPEGKKELVGFQTGVRESAQSWRELLIDIKQRGLEIAPDLAVGDGALGFWKAIEQVFPSTRHQRCWVHKTANVLNKVALSVQVNMKTDLREIYGAPTRAAAEAAIDVFADKYGAKYEKAVACLTKDREALLAFFDFPAEHWDHLRTSDEMDKSLSTIGAAGDTTTTGSRSRRNRASCRGGQLQTRARSSTFGSACPHLRAPGASVPDGRTIRCNHGNRSGTSAPLISYRLQTRSRAYSRRCVIEPCEQREPCRRRPPNSWCSNWSTPPRKLGGD